MKSSYLPGERLIVVSGEVSGPLGTVNVLFAVDTGATYSTIRPELLAEAGVEADSRLAPVRVLTDSGTATAERYRVPSLHVLGRTVPNLALAVHRLPPAAGFDGLLGLDFLRPGRLTIDFDGRWIELG